MLRLTITRGIGLIAIFTSMLACEKKTVAPVPEELQKQIALGESIFDQKECGKCHLASNDNQEFKGPALTSVHLAEDTLLAKYRLYHIEPSKMPPIPLTHQETCAGAVSRFFACQSVHAGLSYRCRCALPGVWRGFGKSGGDQKLSGSISRWQVLLF
jgi:hypothetical protein